MCVNAWKNLQRNTLATATWCSMAYERQKNKKHTYRLYTEEGLQVRTNKRKKLQRNRLVMDVPTRLNQRWSIDFVSNQLSNGRRFRVLNVVDDYSREVIG